MTDSRNPDKTAPPRAIADSAPSSEAVAAPTPPSGGLASPHQPPAIEVHSVDYVPLTERHGKARDLGSFFFMGNAQIGAIVGGVVGGAAGGNLFWSLIAIVFGTLLSTVLVALHAAQGPKLGLPQMIQSRPQFGYVGAVLIWVACLINYFGYAVFPSILAAQSIGTAVHSEANPWLWLIVPVTFAIALVGYNLFHTLGRWVTYGFIVVFGILTVAALVNLPLPSGQLSLNGFKTVPFLLQFGVTVGYQIGWAVYVSDYSRYLPADLSVRRSTAWLYAGSSISAIWMLGLGAYLTAVAKGESFDPVGSIYAAAQTVFPAFGAIVLLFSAVSLVVSGAVNLYGASLTLLCITDSLRPVRTTLTARVVTLGIAAVSVLAVSLALSANFLANFENFLLLLLYIFVPWTAVNLVDFYVVRHGRYAVSEIFNPNGIYGRWGWPGIIAYLVGLAAEVPFMSSPLYTGVVAEKLGGADISLFVGLPVAAGLYLILCRSYDLEAEFCIGSGRSIGGWRAQAVVAST